MVTYKQNRLKLFVSRNSYYFNILIKKQLDSVL